MVSAFGLDVFGWRLMRLFLLNLILLLLNLRLWSRDEIQTDDRESIYLAPNNLRRRVSASDRLEEIQLMEFEKDYDEETQSEVVEKWKKRSRPVSPRKPHASFSSGILNETKRRRIPTRSSQQRSVPSIQNVHELYHIPKVEFTDLVNCASLLQGDARELDRAEDAMKVRPKIPVDEDQYLDWTRDCERFKKIRGYVRVPLSEEEADYPLAFSLAVYRDVEQAERLLRAIYQPQNLYCIHVDTKSPLLFHQAVLSIARCFDNVWVSTNISKVKWGDISVILPEINCMRDLLKYFRGKYKYFINLTGQEFPLRTNLELVWIAKIFNGSNDIAGSSSRMDLERVEYTWTHRWSKTYQQTIFYNTYQSKSPYPVPLKFFKGELHALFSRRFTEYLIESEHGRKYLEWCWDTGHPSEHYWNTLNYNRHLGAPGGYEGPLEAAENYSTHPIVRAKNWVGLYDELPCSGKVLRGICVYGVRDAPQLAQRPELFANKFNLTFDYLGLDCLEERHRNRTMMRSRVPFDGQLYRRLPTVKHGRKDGL